MADQVVSADICSKMVESATKACQPMISVPPEPANKTADSLAALSTAFTFGSIVLAVIVVIAGFAWAKIVAANAEREARAEAKKVAKECADEYIKDWLAKEAPGIIRERVDLIVDATLGSGDDATAADDLGEQAG
jgi:hypothetical protein